MKKRIKTFSLTSFLVFLVSCDPAHDIVFINNTSAAAKVKFNLNTKFKNYRLSEELTVDSIVFNLKQKDTANLYFGIDKRNKNLYPERFNYHP